MNALRAVVHSREELLGDIPFVGRESEALRLRDAILKRESLLIAGPAGIGKTSLLLKVLGGLPAATTRYCLYLSGEEGVQPLLRWLLQQLYGLEDVTLRRQLHVEGIRESTFKSWLKQQPTSRLKGAVYRSMEKGSYWVFIDHSPPLTHAEAKIIRELAWMRKTPVFLLARGLTERDAGHVGSVYWGSKQQLLLSPLSEQAGRELLEFCIHKFDLGKLDLEDFREEVLRLSGLLPGAILKICSLAGDPRYQSGSRIKTKLIYIDSLVNGYNSGLRQTKPGLAT
jgi:energy-coupling factor transporter ATP-binding protein EcfA2